MTPIHLEMIRAKILSIAEPTPSTEQWLELRKLAIAERLPICCSDGNPRGAQLQISYWIGSALPIHRLIRRPTKQQAYEFRAMEALLDTLQGQPAIIWVDSTNIADFLNNRFHFKRNGTPACVWRVLRKFRASQAQVIWRDQKTVNRYLALSKRSKPLKDLLTCKPTVSSM